LTKKAALPKSVAGSVYPTLSLLVWNVVQATVSATLVEVYPTAGKMLENAINKKESRVGLSGVGRDSIIKVQLWERGAGYAQESRYTYVRTYPFSCLSLQAHCRLL